jgi:hypothetical protein
MVKIFTTPFATDGTRSEIPDAVQSSGSVSFSEGFGYDYERDPTDTAYKPVPRPETNQLYYQITQAIAQLQTWGFAEWQVISGGYDENAIVRSGGIVWRSTVSGNTSTPGVSTTWVNTLLVTSGMAVISTVGTSIWTVPDVLRLGLRYATVEVQGPGGGGSRGTIQACGGGGGAGGYAKKVIDLTGVTSITCIVPDGGAGAVSVGQDGGNGLGNCQFGSYLYATPGQGGQGTSNAGGQPGIGVNGTLNLQGGWGSDGQDYAIWNGLTGSGDGGASFFGGGGRSARLANNAGRSGTAPGSGGGAGMGDSTGGPGGKGAPSIITLSW